MAEEALPAVVTNTGQPMTVVAAPFSSVFSLEIVQSVTTEFPANKTLVLDPVRK